MLVFRFDPSFSISSQKIEALIGSLVGGNSPSLRTNKTSRPLKKSLKKKKRKKNEKSHVRFEEWTVASSFFTLL